jgi:hypothetical protein
MRQYEGLNDADWKIIRLALEKLPITGADAKMMVSLQQKIQMEIDLVDTPLKERPKKGDIVTKQ